jgi:hypothetical protein
MTEVRTGGMVRTAPRATAGGPTLPAHGAGARLLLTAIPQS